MNRTRIYVASSWRNPHQGELVERLRAFGFDVYDFKNPPGKDGFSWSEIDPEWRKWKAVEFTTALDHPLAQLGFGADMGALANAHACVLLLPCGRSAHIELGYAVGAGKFSAVLMPKEGEEPELMYAMCDLVTDDVEQIYAAICKRFGRPSTVAAVAV